MKTINCFIRLFCVMLLMSPLLGCGAEEQPKNDITQQPTPPTVAEQKAGIPSGEAVEAPGPTQTEIEIIYEITIDNQGYESDKTGPVTFSHAKHYYEYKIDCTQCHHIYQDGQNIWKQGDGVETCVTCHHQNEAQDNVFKLQKAFHENCRGCHSEASKEGKEAPYRKCSDCHG